MGMVDAVESCCQVSVERPAPPGAFALGDAEDGPDRIVTAPARPKPIGLRLEPGLPFGFQGGEDLGLSHPVHHHRNPERALLPVRLGDVHPPERLERGAVAVLDQVGQSGLPRCSHDHDAVDTGRPASSIALSHPPHAQERIGT